MAADLPIEKIKTFVQSGRLRWTNHVVMRILQRGISTDDITKALSNGKVIEDYPNDYPYPSYLVLGISLNNQCIHVVCDIAESELWLITAYYPNPQKWNADFTIRKE